MLGGLLFALPAPAVEFGEGELQGSFDTTLSHGVNFRIEGQEERARHFRSANSNDGNLNYAKGIVSNTSKLTTDLDLGYRSFGAFVRATGFVDFENDGGDRDRGIPLSDEARDIVGRDFEVLDAYVTAGFEPGGTPVDVRLGRHVLNWGESTFITNGINAFNRFDVGKLRLPGSELREALAPTSMVSVSAVPTDTLSVEGFYQLDWQETVIDPAGSYYSTNDIAGPGARGAIITHPDFAALFERFGPEPERGFSFGPLTPAINADLVRSGLTHRYVDPEFGFMTVVRRPDREPDDSGQWGVALRYLAEDLNQTEFGLHFGSYHSRLPLVSARTAGPIAIQTGLAAAGAVGAPGSATSAALATQATPAVLEAVTAQVTAGVRAGQIPPAAAERIIGERVAQEVGDRVRPLVSGIATALAIDRYTAPDYGGSSGYYYIEHPEDIRFLGLSFNSVLGASGWALQGEYTLHMDTPLQRSEPDLIREGISPILDALRLVQAGDELALARHIGTHEPSDIRGYVRHDVSQLQVTATKAFGPMLGSGGLLLAAEAAMMRVHDLTDLPVESPARTRHLDDDDATADADAISWGYRAAAKLEYGNAIGAVSLFPFVQWGHDVGGNSPTPIGSFAEGRTTLTVGVGADYLSRWQASVGLTMYGGLRNTLYDRDFLSASVKYSF